MNFLKRGILTCLIASIGLQTTVCNADPKPFTVIYDAMGGEPARSVVLYDGWYEKFRVFEYIEWGFETPIIESLPTPVYDGYVFDGWWSDRGADGRPLYDEYQVVVGREVLADATFYAHWVRGCYIEFDTYIWQEEECDVKGVTYPIGGEVVELPVPTREHYEFWGWFDESGQKVSVPFVAPDHDLKLKARWQGKPYVVILDATEGECEIKSVVMHYGEYFWGAQRDGRLPEATREGFRFLGWYRLDGLNPIDFYGDTYVDGDMTLYAHWSTSLRLIFDPAGGVCDTESRLIECGQIYGHLPSASRVGFDFLGWYNAEIGGTKVDESTPIRLDGETVYAHWKGHRYSINLEANGADGALEGLTLPYGVEIDLPATGLTRAGYAFAGWALSSNGVVVYPVGEKVGNVTPVDGETVTLYAVWVPVPLSMSYAQQRYPWNGLADVSVSVDGSEGSDYRVAFQVETPEGAVKNLLAVRPAGGGTSQRVQTVGSGESAFVWDVASDLATAYAAGELKIRAVAFDKQLDVVSSSEWMEMGVVDAGVASGRIAGKQPFAYDCAWADGGVKSVLKANGTVIAELNGRGTFEWIGAGGQAYALTLEILDSKGEKVGGTYSIEWEWVTRSTLTFIGNLDGIGNWTQIYDDTYAYGEFPHVEKPCYEFLGWYTDPAAGERVEESDISNGDKTLYGHWKAFGYRIVFDANGGTGTMPDQVIRGGVATPLAVCTYGVSDLVCVGWSMNPDGPVQFKNGEEVLDLLPLTKDLRLYAIWAFEDVELKSFRQRYPWNGLVDIDIDLTGAGGRDYTVFVEARDNVGGTNLNVRTVLDEDLSAKGNPLVVSAGPRRIVWNADADLPDGFKCDDVSMRVALVTTIAFDPKGGQCDVTKRQYVLGAPYGELPTATKEGFVFKGWYGDESYETEVTDKSTVGSSASILYARWEATGK